MERLIQPAVLRGVVLTLVGAAGALIGIIWPLGHKAFCAGIAGMVL